MKTVILTFQGGDQYNKKKQVNSILSKISEAEWLDIDLNSLEESISPENRTIIIREESDYIDFDRIIRSEYPRLSEQIEVIPEKFFRLKENNPDQTAVQQPVQQATQPSSEALYYCELNNNDYVQRLVIPVEFPLSAEFFQRNVSQIGSLSHDLHKSNHSCSYDRNSGFSLIVL